MVEHISFNSASLSPAFEAVGSGITLFGMLRVGKDTISFSI